MPDELKTDLKVIFRPDGTADLAVGSEDLETVRGVNNLVQALTLRLLVDQGELAGLGHSRYGTRIRELLGETLDRANLELLRRYVRQTLLQDPRVEEVIRVVVQPRKTETGVVDVEAAVTAVDGNEAEIEVTLYAR